MKSCHSHDTPSCAGKPVSPLEIPLHSAGFDERDMIVLKCARLFFESFAEPDRQSWILGFQSPGMRYGDENGGSIANKVLTSVQAMRQSRRSCFRFNNPHCSHCSQSLTEHERLFMRIFQALKNRKSAVAYSYAMLLCELNPIGDFMGAMKELVEQTDQLELEIAP